MPGPTFVIVPGACGTAQTYSPLLRELALRGYRGLAVDLPGHGMPAGLPRAYQVPQDLAALAASPSPLAGITVRDNVDHVVTVVEQAARYGPVILVGQSAGGLTISGVGNTVPHLIDRLVYLAAFCCVDLPGLADYYQTPESASTLLFRVPPTIPTTAQPVNRFNWRSGDPSVLAALREALAADWPEPQFLAFLNTMDPAESPLAGDARGSAGTWGRIPRTYIRFTRDRVIPPALQDRMIREADALTPDNPFDVVSVEAGHIGPADPRVLADILAGLG